MCCFDGRFDPLNKGAPGLDVNASTLVVHGLKNLYRSCNPSDLGTVDEPDQEDISFADDLTKSG